MEKEKIYFFNIHGKLMFYYPEDVVIDTSPGSWNEVEAYLVEEDEK